MATLSEVQDAYDANADYDEDNSLSKAKAFRTACRRLLAKLPSSSLRGYMGGSQQSLQFRLDEIRRALKDSEAWIAMHNSSGAPDVVHPDFSGGCRDY